MTNFSQSLTRQTTSLDSFSSNLSKHDPAGSDARTQINLKNDKLFWK